MIEKDVKKDIEGWKERYRRLERKIQEVRKKDIEDQKERKREKEGRKERCRMLDKF